MKLNSNATFFLFFLLFLVVQGQAFSQNCECTISQVQDNSVAPCELVIGTVFNVSSVSEFYDAINEANANDNITILIADGTYAVASTDQYPYLTGSNVVIRSASGNRDAVILTGQGMVDVAPLTEIGIFAVGDNITIADLTIKDLGNHGIAVTGDHLYVHNVCIQNTFEQMIKGNSGGDGSSNSVVQCSLFEYTAGIGPQWYIGGLDIHEGMSWRVSDNVFKDIASPSLSLAEHAVHFWDFSADNIVERNLIINCDRGIGFGLGSSPNEAGIIRNNMIYNNGNDPFHDVGIGLETSPNSRIYNNTIHIAYQNAIEYRFPETMNVDIVNNLCNNGIASRNDGQASLSSNIITAAYDWYVDPSIGDLHLAAPHQLVIDQGDPLDAFIDDDFDKMARPVGPALDIGAQEFPQSTGLKDIDQFEINLYPSPAQNFVVVSWDRPGILHGKIYTFDGRLIYDKVMTRDQQQVYIDVGDWSRGNYLFVIVDIKAGIRVNRSFVLD